MKNYIKILNGDLIPDYISTNIIFIDTEQITTNHIENPFEIIIPNGFFPVSTVVDNVGSSQEIRAEQIGDLFQNTYFDVGVSLFSSFLASLSQNVLIYGFSTGENEYVRFLFKCEKMNL